MGDSLRVTMVATGLGNPVRHHAPKPVMHIVEPMLPATGIDGMPIFAGSQVGYNPEQNYDIPTTIRTGRRGSQAAVEASHAAGIDTLDIPAFLRKQAD